MGNLKINGNLLMPLNNTRMILGSNGTTDYVDICFKRGAKNNEMYLCGDADGQGGHINVQSSDGFNGLHIKVDRTVFEKEILVNGLIYSGNNGNTLTIGSMNTSYCHFQNSANIPFHFNKDVRVQGNLYMGTGYSDLVLSSANYTDYTVTKTGTGASGTWSISVSGNAATATKLKKSRTLTIGNTGKSFNGSANVSWSLAEIGALPITGGTISGGTGDTLLYLQSNIASSYIGFKNNSGTVIGYFGVNANNKPVFYDTKDRILLYDGNYTSYTVKKDGTGASGTWGISITGNASGAGYVQGTYSGSGGQQKPNYFGTNKVGFLMMNTTVNGDDSYKDWMIMDCYDGNDVGGAVAFGISRTSGRVFYMGSAAARTAWTWDGEFITDGNIGSQHVRSAWYTKATNTYEGNTIISTSTTAEALFNGESLMSCAFMNTGDPFSSYADVIYYSGYQHWGGTQIATEYNTRYKPRMAIRKYSQTVGGWGSWGYIHTNHLSYIYGSSLPTSGMATGDIFYLIK